MQGTFVFSHGTDRGTEIPEGYILKPYEPGTFFEVLQQEELEVQLPGGIRSQLKVQKKDPKLVIRIRRYGRDGVEAVLEGVRTDEEGDTEPVLAFSGESGAFILSQERPSAAVPTTSARRQVPFGADHKGEGIPDPGRSKGHSSFI